jgi:AraC family L-rhamnose operon transcriptional activator RhaR/AraC family L-rhamnose operon regulatory protein RhaS
MFFHEPLLPVEVLHRDPEIPFSLHSHDFFELVIVVSGQGLHLLGDESVPISEGNAFLIRPGRRHGYSEIRDLALYNVLIGERALTLHLHEFTEINGFRELFLQDGEEVPLVKLNNYQLGEAVAIVTAIRQESERQIHTYGSRALTYAKLLQLIVLFCRTYSVHKASTFIPDQRLEDVIAYMEEHLDRSVSLKELAAYAAMSTSTLNRQFKLSTGWSPVDFHIHRRISYASKLLLTTDLSMERISEQTGFSDANYFARQFRTHMRMSPREYKQLWTKATDES